MKMRYSAISLDFSAAVLVALLTACNGEHAITPQLPAASSAQSSLPQSLAAKKPPHYTIAVLDTLGGSNNSGSAINERGGVTGFSLLAGDVLGHAFLEQRGIIRDLGTLGGSISFVNENQAVNARDEITGTSETTIPDPNAENLCSTSGNACRAFLWKRGTMEMLPTLGGNNAQGVAINNRGQVVGVSETSTRLSCPALFLFAFKAFTWEKGNITALPLLPRDNASLAVGINDVGQVVGTSGFCAIARHSVLWQNGNIIDLGSLGGTDGNLPSAINNRGEVIGESDLFGDARHHAFVWRRGVISDLGTLPGDADSSANSINNKGQISGMSFDINGNSRAVLWSDGSMWDLNNLIPPHSGLVLEQALGINDGGEIAGFACVTCDGTDQRAFLATPSQSWQTGARTVTSTVAEPKASAMQRAQNLWQRIVHRTSLRFGGVRTQ